MQDIPWGPPGVYGYGYFWYSGHTPGESGFPVFRVSGNGDQRIFVLPEQEIVVTLYAGLYNQPRRVSERIVRAILAAMDEP